MSLLYMKLGLDLNTLHKPLRLRMIKKLLKKNEQRSKILHTFV